MNPTTILANIQNLVREGTRNQNKTTAYDAVGVIKNLKTPKKSSTR